jgi:uncharacterized protein DUF1707
MSTTLDRGIDALTDLLRPEGRSASDTDRSSASYAVRAAVADGRLPETDGDGRLHAIESAEHRGELRLALSGISGALPPRGLTTALGAASAVWLVTTALQVVVWLTMALATAHLDTPWWLYSAVGGGMIVGVLWLAHESYHRTPGTR